MTRKKRYPPTRLNRALDVLFPIYKRYEPAYTSKQWKNMAIGLIAAGIKMGLVYLMAFVAFMLTS